MTTLSDEAIVPVSAPAAGTRANISSTGIIASVGDDVAGVGSVQSGLLRVLIVDDHEVLRTGTRQVLEASDDIVVVGEADDTRRNWLLYHDRQTSFVL